MNKKEFYLFLNKQKKERDAITEKIVSSLYPKKVIVSGPGTGLKDQLSRVEQQLGKIRKGNENE